jgi:hypothetical protein
MVTDLTTLFYDTNEVTHEELEDPQAPDRDILCLYEENIARMYSIE